MMQASVQLDVMPAVTAGIMAYGTSGAKSANELYVKDNGQLCHTFGSSDVNLGEGVCSQNLSLDLAAWTATEITVTLVFDGSTRSMFANGKPILGPQTLLIGFANELPSSQDSNTLCLMARVTGNRGSSGAVGTIRDARVRTGVHEVVLSPYSPPPAPPRCDPLLQCSDSGSTRDQCRPTDEDNLADLHVSNLGYGVISKNSSSSSDCSMQCARKGHDDYDPPRPITHFTYYQDLKYCYCWYRLPSLDDDGVVVVLGYVPGHYTGSVCAQLPSAPPPSPPPVPPLPYGPLETSLSCATSADACVFSAVYPLASTEDTNFKGHCYENWEIGTSDLLCTRMRDRAATNPNALGNEFNHDRRCYMTFESHGEAVDAYEANSRAYADAVCAGDPEYQYVSYGNFLAGFVLCTRACGTPGTLGVGAFTDAQIYARPSN